MRIPSTIQRPGHPLPVVQYIMRVTVNPVLNPIVHMIAPDTNFFQTKDSPPAMVRFAGPRNYAGQEIPSRVILARALQRPAAGSV